MSHFFTSLSSQRFVFKESGFEQPHQDVRCGAFPELQKFWPLANRADGGNRPPSKNELREMLFGDEWQATSERERGEKLRDVQWSTRHSVTNVTDATK